MPERYKEEILRASALPEGALGSLVSGVRPVRQAVRAGLQDRAAGARDHLVGRGALLAERPHVVRCARPSADQPVVGDRCARAPPSPIVVNHRAVGAGEQALVGVEEMNVEIGLGPARIELQERPAGPAVRRREHGALPDPRRQRLREGHRAAVPRDELKDKITRFMAALVNECRARGVSLLFTVETESLFGLELKLRELGVPHDDLTVMAHAVNTERLGNNPLAFHEDDLLALGLETLG